MAHQVALALCAQRLLAVLQQIADVEQLQQPVAGLPQQPASGMQRTATDRLEIQIQRLRLPVHGLSLKHHQTVGLHIVLQSHLAVRRQRQRRTQGAGQALYPGTVVEPYLQPHGGHTGR
ncbi:hypothetical protein D9M71_457580 [compost metagenome]